MISKQLCLETMQGKLFEKSALLGYDSDTFIKCFMRSDLTSCLDKEYSRYQCVDEDYWLEELKDEYGKRLKKSVSVWDSEAMFWIGWLYRYWHYEFSKSSKEILSLAPPKRMISMYLPYHTLDPNDAIERLQN